MAPIEVYADVWCPFAHAGLRWALRRMRDLGGGDVALRIRAWPLELVNGAPLDPAATARHVDELRRQVAPDLFAGFDQARFPRTSLPALALAAAAYRCDERTGQAVGLALRDALFEQGRDISAPEVLRAVAAGHGVGDPDNEDVEAVLADWHAGEARGVRGSPHFFCGDADVFCPSLRIVKEGGRVDITRDLAALDAFLGACLTAPPQPEES